MKYPLMYYAICFCLIITSCTSSNKYTKQLKAGKGTLANFIEIEEGLLVQQTEVTHRMWQTYLQDLQVAFQERAAALVSEAQPQWVWNVENCQAPAYLVDSSHPKMQDYPVVGINQSQIEGYLQYKNNLIQTQILGKLLEQRPEIQQKLVAEQSLSTKEIFDELEIESIKIPKFTLPTAAQWKQIQAYQQDMLKKQKTTCPETLPQIVQKFACQKDNFSMPLQIAQQETPITCKQKNFLHHVNDNVSEWLQEENTFAGSNWTDTQLVQANRKSKSATNFIGFRPVLTYVDWDGSVD